MSWTTRSGRLKDVAHYINRGVAPRYVDEPTGFVAFSQKCTRPSRAVDPTLGRPMLNPGSTASSSFLRPGDLVVNSTGTGTLGRVGLIEDPHVEGRALVADAHVTIVRPNPRLVDPRFLWYQLSTDAFYDLANATLAVGSTNQTELGRSVLGSVTVWLPELDEQRRIVYALDNEIARIEDLIAEQTRMVELLLERRAAAVFDAVTGQSVAGSRRTGLPWAAHLPADWRTARLTSVARLGSGHTPSRNRPELWEDCTIPWITTGEVWQIRSDIVEVLTDTRERISESGVAESAAVVHPAGTVVLCRTAASAGYSAIMGLEMATSQDFAAWTCGEELVPEYLLYCLRAMRRDLLERLAMGSTHRTIYMPDIKGICVPLPSVAVQNHIVAELRRELKILDDSVAELGRQRVLLREHRQALILAATAGEMDAVKKEA